MLLGMRSRPRAALHQYSIHDHSAFDWTGVSWGNDGGNITLGTSFIPDRNGTLRKYAFVKPNVDWGTVKGCIWRASDGVLIGSTDFPTAWTSNAFNFGWIEVDADTPVTLLAGTEYYIGIATAGWYLAKGGVWSSDTTVGPFFMPGDTHATAGNGAFRYTNSLEMPNLGGAGAGYGFFTDLVMDAE